VGGGRKEMPPHCFFFQKKGFEKTHQQREMGGGGGEASKLFTLSQNSVNDVNRLSRSRLIFIRHTLMVFRLAPQFS